jgi:hypothetical protein
LRQDGKEEEKLSIIYTLGFLGLKMNDKTEKEKITMKKLSNRRQKVVKKLSKSCQKVVKKISFCFQKVFKKFVKILKRVRGGEEEEEGVEEEGDL